MTVRIKKAERKGLRGRIAICGPTGSGKTWTSLALAKVLAGDKRICLIDTEHESSDRYADVYDFDKIDLYSFSPDEYVEAMRAIDPSIYGVTIVDSLSHAWTGKGGALEQVNDAATRSGNNNKYVAWRDVTPMHNRLVEALLSQPTHLIVTMRSKMEYVMEKDPSGRTIITRVGMAPIQREGVEYEFDIVGDMTTDNRFMVTKTRFSSLNGKIIVKPGADLGRTILAELGSVPTDDNWVPTKADFELLIKTAADHGQTTADIGRLVVKMYGEGKTPKDLNRQQFTNVLNQIQGEPTIG